MKPRGIVLIAIGAFLLIAGVAGFIFSSNQSKEYETGMGQMARGFDSDAQSQYNALTGIKVVSGIAMAAGGLLIVIGLVTGIRRDGFAYQQSIAAPGQGTYSGAKPVRKPPPRPPVGNGAPAGIGSRYCTQCGERLLAGSKFCEGCGAQAIHQDSIVGPPVAATALRREEPRINRVAACKRAMRAHISENSPSAIGKIQIPDLKLNDSGDAASGVATAKYMSGEKRGQRLPPAMVKAELRDGVWIITQFEPLQTS